MRAGRAAHSASTRRGDREELPGPSPKLRGLVAEHAPALFAVGVESAGHDSTIVAWGLAFPDHAEVVSVQGDYHLSTTSPEYALRHFQEGGARTLLVWTAGDDTAVTGPRTTDRP